jgi:hypothetical protein
MIKISEEHQMIYFLLEQKEIAFNGFKSDRVESFDHEWDFCLVVFLHASNRLILFSAENYREEKNALNELRNYFQETSEELPQSLQRQAMRLIEDKIMKTASEQFYFDAH